MSIQILGTALTAVMPIVLLIVLGWLLRKKGFLTDQFLSVGNKLVFTVCLPVMLFINVYHIASVSDIRWDICLYSVAAVAVLFLLGVVVALIVTPKPERRGVLLQCSFRSNFAIIGMPLATSLGGEAGAAVAAVLSAVVVPVFNVLAVIALSVFRREEDGRPVSGRKLLLDMVKNPLINGVVLGVVALLIRQWQVLQFGRVVFSLQRDLPWLYSAAKDIKSIASPFALLLLGGQFRFSAVKALWKEVAAGTVFRTVAAPLLGVGGAVLLGSWGVLQCGTAEYPALVALFGSPVAVSSAIMAREMHNDEQLATQLVVWTSVVSVVTVFLTVCLMMSLGLLPD